MEADDNELDDLFCGTPPDKERLDSTLKTILKNIAKVKSIPMEKRKYDF